MVEQAALKEFPSIAKALKLDLNLDEFKTNERRLEYLRKNIMNNFDVEIGSF